MKKSLIDTLRWIIFIPVGLSVFWVTQYFFSKYTEVENWKIMYSEVDYDDIFKAVWIHIFTISIPIGMGFLWGVKTAPSKRNIANAILLFLFSMFFIYIIIKSGDGFHFESYRKVFRYVIVIFAIILGICAGFFGTKEWIVENEGKKEKFWF